MPAGHGVEPLADRLRQLGLPRAEHLGDGAEPALHLGLRLQDAGHAGFGVAGMVGGLRGSDRARLGRAPQRDDQRDEQARNSNAPKRQRLAERDRWWRRGGRPVRTRMAVSSFMRASIADSARR